MTIPNYSSPIIGLVQDAEAAGYVVTYQGPDEDIILIHKLRANGSIDWTKPRVKLLIDVRVDGSTNYKHTVRLGPTNARKKITTIAATRKELGL